MTFRELTHVRNCLIAASDDRVILHVIYNAELSLYPSYLYTPPGCFIVTLNENARHTTTTNFICINEEEKGNCFVIMGKRNGHYDEDIPQ